MIKITNTTRQIIINLLVISAIMLVIGLVFRFDKPLSYILGILLGSSFSVFKIIYLERSLDKAFDNVKDARNIFTGGIVIRYFMTGAILVIAAVVPGISLVGCIIGVLALQAAAFAMKLFIK